MPSYPLPTLAPTINAAGCSIPSYNDILLSLQASYEAIYGNDINWDAGNQDTQWLAVNAQAQYDTNMAILLDYQQKSPATAVGVGLSSVVKINGLQRLVPSNSTAVVTIGGPAFTQINNGIVGDNLNQGTQWALPSSVTIGAGGTVNVTATCTTAGAIQAAPGVLTEILTPSAGWQTVTNAANASPGEPVEGDPELKIRQTNSTENAAETIIGAMYGQIANLTGVSAVNPYVNNTGSTDGNGVPAHSIAMVVEGGTLQSIVNVIGSTKAPGIPTYGGTSGTYTDPTTGQPLTISYSVMALQTILVDITLTPLTGYTTAIGGYIQAAVAAYIAALPPATNVLLSRLQVPAQLAGIYGAQTVAAALGITQDAAYPIAAAASLTFEITSITAAISPGSPGGSDITIAWNQRATCAASNVSLTT